MVREYDEKRDFIRVTVDCELTYIEPHKGQEELGTAKNLSGRGLLFIAERELHHVTGPHTFLHAVFVKSVVKRKLFSEVDALRDLFEGLRVADSAQRCMAN